ncbi:MAG: TIGR01777 family oxidoreductase [Polyangiaceae bacterium]|nr:TIGR01777 family oxidoreductase [Polyangiaceae bacterium]
MGTKTRGPASKGVVRIIVTGGTGFIGRKLVRSLCERGDDVTIFTRRRASACGAGFGARPTCCRGSGKVELVPWTPDRPGPWQNLVDGADAVVNLAGAGIFDERWTPDRKRVLRDSRILSTTLLAEAVERATNKPGVFVSGSAVGYYGTHCGDRALIEDDLAGTDFLAQLTIEWEAAAAPARDAGVRVCHPRTGIVLGTDGGMLAKLLPLFRAYVGGPVGHGTQFIAWIHAADVIRAIEHAIDHASMSGPFNMVAPEPATMNDFARELGDALDRPSHVRVPALAVKLALGEGSDAVLTGQRAVPHRLVAEGFAFLFPELASALADLTSPPSI